MRGQANIGILRFKIDLFTTPLPNPHPAGAGRGSIFQRHDTHCLIQRNKPISRMYFRTPGWIRSWRGAAASVFASVDSFA